MKVYFTSQLYEKEKYINYFRAITDTIKKLGHQLIVDVYDYDAEFVLTQSQQTLQEYYQQWRRYLKDMDACVAEISFPSTINIGFEIASILNYGKPVIAMYRQGTDPVFTSSEFSQRMIKVEYTLENVKEVLEWALEEAEEWRSRRFTLIIPSKIDVFLDKISQAGEISRSEYIRNLIEKDMEKK